MVAALEYFPSNHLRHVVQISRPNTTHENVGCPSSQIPSASGLETRCNPESDAARRCRIGTHTLQRLLFSIDSVK